LVLEDFIIVALLVFAFNYFYRIQKATFSSKTFIHRWRKHLKLWRKKALLFSTWRIGLRDLDIFLVSGSLIEFNIDLTFNITDRLLIIDGHGNFTISKDRIPVISASGSHFVKISDFDQRWFRWPLYGGRTPFYKSKIRKKFLIEKWKGVLKGRYRFNCTRTKEHSMINRCSMGRYRFRWLWRFSSLPVN